MLLRRFEIDFGVVLGVLRNFQEAPGDGAVIVEGLRPGELNLDRKSVV